MNSQGPVEKSAPSRAGAFTDKRRSNRIVEQLQLSLTTLQLRQAELENENRDLREAHATTEALHQCYVELYEGSPVSHVILDKDGIILRANRAAGELLGMPVRRLIHKPFHLFVLRDSLNDYRAHCREAILTRQKVSCEALLRIRDRNPVEAHIEMVGTRLPEADGPVCHLAIVEIGELEMSEDGALVDSATVPSNGRSHSWPRAVHDINSAAAGIKNILNLLGTALTAEHPYARYIPMAEDKLKEIALALRTPSPPREHPDPASPAAETETAEQE